MSASGHSREVGAVPRDIPRLGGFWDVTNNDS